MSCYSASDSIRPNQANAVTPRKLGARQNPITSAFNINEVISDELGNHYSSSESSLSTQSNAEIPRKLGGQQQLLFPCLSLKQLEVGYMNPCKLGDNNNNNYYYFYTSVSNKLSLFI